MACIPLDVGSVRCSLSCADERRADRGDESLPALGLLSDDVVHHLAYRSVLGGHNGTVMLPDVHDPSLDPLATHRASAELVIEAE